MRSHDLFRLLVSGAMLLAVSPVSSAQHEGPAPMTGQAAHQHEEPMQHGGHGDQKPPSTMSRPTHDESAATQTAQELVYSDDPSIPAGMTLDQVLSRAAQPPPRHFPLVLHDSPLRFFSLVEQLEYRMNEESRNSYGLEAQGWIGYDYNRFWWKAEGEALLDGQDEGELELDLLYSHAIAPFWDAQVGVQVAHEWESSDSNNRWSAVAGFQGIAPGQFEVDTALYLSEDGDVLANAEAEFNVRFTQRLVLQPRTEFQLAAQDITERSLGAGLTDILFDLRLRYEFRRDLAPYIGARYSTLVGETENLAESAGEDTESLALLLGLRLAF